MRCDVCVGKPTTIFMYLSLTTQMIRTTNTILMHIQAFRSSMCIVWMKIAANGTTEWAGEQAMALKLIDVDIYIFTISLHVKRNGGQQSTVTFAINGTFVGFFGATFWFETLSMANAVNKMQYFFFLDFFDLWIPRNKQKANWFVAYKL